MSFIMSKPTHENNSGARIHVVVIVPEEDGRVVQGMLIAQDAQ